ncbi:MAG: DUF2662 domain-containing protein [Acidimicrobiia bacterium]
MGLQQFERRLERLVEGVFAKAFRSSLRPVELGRRLTREMDLQRTVGVRGETIAPNRFRFALSPRDRANFAPFEDSLVRELADAARDHARAEGYVLLGPVEIELVTDPTVTTGQFFLAGDVHAAPGGGPSRALVLPDGRRVVLAEESVIIGRLPDCDVVVADPGVSRRHAEVRPEGDGWVVVDLDSTNGTRVNGVGVTRRRLADGDVITVGNTAIRFEMA